MRAERVKGHFRFHFTAEKNQEDFHALSGGKDAGDHRFDSGKGAFKHTGRFARPKRFIEHLLFFLAQFRPEGFNDRRGYAGGPVAKRDQAADIHGIRNGLSMANRIEMREDIARE